MFCRHITVGQRGNSHSVGNLDILESILILIKMKYPQTSTFSKIQEDTSLEMPEFQKFLVNSIV